MLFYRKVWNIKNKTRKKSLFKQGFFLIKKAVSWQTKSMSIILVSDVFGVTPALLEISEKLGSCTIVDPYKGQMMGFQNEAEAYSYFVKEVGLDNYLSILLEAVESIEYQVTLIGFSIGASVVWRLSGKEGNNLIKQAYCFYGSQIRNFTLIEPRFRVFLVFPKSEPNFDVVELQNNLSRKANVKTKKVEYLHGFMNDYSNNYNSSGYTEHINLLCSITSLQAIQAGLLTDG